MIETNPSQQPQDTENNMPLMRNNFILMIAAGIMIVLGFILMTGSASGIDEYNPEIFSTRRIVVGPFISFLGFVLMAVAIIIRPKNKI